MIGCGAGRGEGGLAPEEGSPFKSRIPPQASRAAQAPPRERTMAPGALPRPRRRPWLPEPQPPPAARAKKGPRRHRFSSATAAPTAAANGSNALPNGHFPHSPFPPLKHHPPAPAVPSRQRSLRGSRYQTRGGGRGRKRQRQPQCFPEKPSPSRAAGEGDERRGRQRVAAGEGAEGSRMAATPFPVTVAASPPLLFTPSPQGGWLGMSPSAASSPPPPAALAQPGGSGVKSAGKGWRELIFFFLFFYVSG